MIRRSLIASSLMLAISLAVPGTSRANPNDISLRSLGRPKSFALSDPAVQRYKSLSTELAFALSTRPLSPAETLGVNGFEFSLVSTFADITETADYWQGQPGTPVFEGVMASHGSRGVPRVFWVPTLHLRKGLPLSTELGINGSYLAWSDMFVVGAEAKIALHESFFRWVPALAGRIAANRLFGASDLDLFTFEADVLVSLPIGVGSALQVTPYGGWGMLFAHVNSQVIDETPYKVTDAASDQKGGHDGSLYTFPTLDWKDNRHQRIFGGLRFNIAMIELLYELDVGILDLQKKTTLMSHSIKLGFDV